MSKNNIQNIYDFIPWGGGFYVYFERKDCTRGYIPAKASRQRYIRSLFIQALRNNVRGIRSNTEGLMIYEVLT